MLSKNQIKFIKSLHQKKFILEHGLFIAEGVKVVSELLQSSIQVKQLYATPVFIAGETIPKHFECVEIKESDLERISALTTPNEVLAVCEIPSYQLNPEAIKEKLTLVLDDIKDPGNLGTIIRIADWFGIENIICSNETTIAYSPKVVQSTMGSIARVSIHYTDLREFFKVQSTKFKVQNFGALLEGENIYTKQLASNGFIVIGNESRGISDELLPFITDKISIPSFSHFKTNGGEAESLNAAVATAIICSEFRRR